MKRIEIEDETFRFLAWLVRQDVTLPSVMVHYLKWNHYSEQDIKNHFLALNMACIDAKKSEKTSMRASPEGKWNINGRGVY